MHIKPKEFIVFMGTVCALCAIGTLTYRIDKDRWPAPFHFLNGDGPISVVPLIKELPASADVSGLFSNDRKDRREQRREKRQADQSQSSNPTPDPTPTPVPSSGGQSSQTSQVSTPTTTPPVVQTPVVTPTPPASETPATPAPTPSTPQVTQIQAPSVPGATTTPIVVPPVVTPPVVAAPIVPDYKVGMALGNTLFNLSQADLTTELNNISSLGIGWIRIDMAWDDVQYDSSTSYDWSAFDRIISTANADNIKVLADLGYTPAWARASGCLANNDTCPPANDAQFTTFAAAAVQRYAPQGVVTYEVWNEPNIGRFWEPSANAAAYTTLLKATYTAIKKQNPGVTVLSAGLAPALTGGNDISPTDFLTAMYQDGAKSYFDALGDHPYSFPATPSMYESWSGWSQMAQTPVNLLSIMNQNGDSAKQIWMTEYGAPTGGPGSAAWLGDTNLISSVDHDTDDLQTETLTEAITDDQQYNWAGPIFIYSYEDLGISSSTVENFFGLLWNDATDKPSYTAIKNLLAQPQQ